MISINLNNFLHFAITNKVETCIKMNINQNAANNPKQILYKVYDGHQ